MAAEHKATPVLPIKYHNAGNKSFVALIDESSMFTQDRALPQPISTNIQTLRDQSGPRRRSLASRFESDIHSAMDGSDIETGLLRSGTLVGGEHDDRRSILAAKLLNTPQMRSQRLIGHSNPRYEWGKYYKTDEELKQMKKPIRKYYERNNYLIQEYLYIDRLLDSSLPHNLIQEYTTPQNLDMPPTTTEVEIPLATPEMNGLPTQDKNVSVASLTSTSTLLNSAVKVKRTPKNLYKVPNEETPLLAQGDAEDSPQPVMPDFEPDEETDSNARIVTVAIYINLIANAILLIMKIVVTVLTSSVSVLASLVDAALDFLSTAIVWTTTRLIATQDQYTYPVGRRKLEPIGVLVFSVIMVTSFVQVALEGLNRLSSKDAHEIVRLSPAAIAIMASTVVVKFLCWLWCRLIKNSSVQALAQDAMTDVVFNIFSIIFPFVGYFFRQWWLDPLGGIVLSLYVIISWSSTSVTHIRNLTGHSASAHERNVLLYLIMRFAKTIKQIQGLQAYHAGDKLIVEADVVVGYSAESECETRNGHVNGETSDEGKEGQEMSLRDSHDLGESLQYVLESVPMVDRAFVHLDYETWNLPSHMAQQE